MIDLVSFFDERYAEVSVYLSFLENVQDAARGGAPRFYGTRATITPDQKKILNSSLYLQLYNLVEATVLRCLEAVVDAVEESGRGPSDLNDSLRTEWVRSVARTHIDLAPEKRLQEAVKLCDQLLQQSPIKDFKIEPGGGGNWDDSSIETMCRRVGCDLTISPNIFRAAKRHIRDDMGALELVKNLRNGLAHGSLSFVDCSDNVTVAELRSLATAVGDYLREAVGCFVYFIESQIFEGGGRVKKGGVGA